MLYYIGMLMAKSLLRDLGSALGPYCTNCVSTKWYGFRNAVTYTVESGFEVHPGS